MGKNRAIFWEMGCNLTTRKPARYRLTLNLLVALIFLFKLNRVQCVKHLGKFQWYFLGPWTVGKNEMDGDPVAAYPGGIIRAFEEKNSERKFFSEMVTGGELTWSKIRSDSSSGEVLVTPSNVDWQKNTQTLSSVETSEWQGWAVV